MGSARGAYVYKDKDGVDVIVQRFKDVPSEYRAQATPLGSRKADVPVPSPGSEDVPADASGRPEVGMAPAAVHWPSFAVGAGTALAAGLVLVLALRRHARVLSLLVAGLAMLAFGVGYLTFIRQQAGLRPAGLATPATILEDSRSAAAAAQKQFKEQEKTLDEIDETR